MRRILPYLVTVFFSILAKGQEPDDLLALKTEEYYINIPAKPDSLKFVTSSFIGRKLPPGSVFIDFIESEVNEEKVFFATLIKHDEEPQVIEIPFPRMKDKLFDNVSKPTQSERGGIIGVNKATSVQSYCSVYKNFWAYLAPSLVDASTVYYSTSRLLNQSNIRFFKDDKGNFLFENYQMIRLHSGASFLGSKQNLIMPNKMDVLLVGNIRYDCAEGSRPGVKKEYTGNWSFLAGAKAETEDIRQQLKGRHYVVNLDSCSATESKFIKLINASRFDMVHIATHGFYFKGAEGSVGITDDSYPLERIGIVLSGANSKTASVEAFNEEGLFTALEFQNLNLSNIRFMVLSTCHSGEGDNNENTATLGVTLALLRQGINAMLVSNRAVPDKDAGLFMKTFYSFAVREQNIDDCYLKTIRELQKKYPGTDWSFFDLVH